MPFKLKYHMVPPDHQHILPESRGRSVQRIAWIETKLAFAECLKAWDGQEGYAYYCSKEDDDYNQKSPEIRVDIPLETKFYGSRVHTGKDGGYTVPELEGK